MVSADPLLLGLAPRPPAPNHPRHPVLAGALALLCPGLGHFYCGSLAEAVLWTALPYLALVGLMSLGVFFAPSHLHRFLLAAAVAWVALRLAQVPVAALRARRLRQYTLRAFNVFPLYVAFFLGSSVATSLMLRPWRAYVAEPFKTSTADMQPTLRPGDQLFVLKAGSGAEVHRFDLIVYRQAATAEGATSLNQIKRVIGLPGDTVEIRNGTLILNGVEQAIAPCDLADVPGCFTEGTHRILRNGAASDIPSRLVPPDRYFALSDTRDAAQGDGLVAFNDVVGRAAIIWLSISDGLNIRWDQIGRPL